MGVGSAVKKSIFHALRSDFSVHLNASWLQMDSEAQSQLYLNHGAKDSMISNCTFLVHTRKKKHLELKFSGAGVQQLPAYFQTHTNLGQHVATLCFHANPFFVRLA